MFYETEMERREETIIASTYDRMMRLLQTQMNYCMKEESYKALSRLQDVYRDWWRVEGSLLSTQFYNQISSARIVLDETNLGLYLDKSINNVIREFVIPEVKKIMSEINWTQRLLDKDIPTNLKTSDIVTLAGPLNPVDGSPLTNDWVNEHLGRPTGAEYGDTTAVDETGVTSEDTEEAPLEDGGEPEATDTPDDEEDTEEEAE